MYAPSGCTEVAFQAGRTRCEHVTECVSVRLTHYAYRPGYNGTAIVERSVEIGEPVIFVAVNYRYGHHMRLLRRLAHAWYAASTCSASWEDHK